MAAAVIKGNYHGSILYLWHLLPVADPGKGPWIPPPPQPTPLSPLSQSLDPALVELQMDCQNLLHGSIQIFPNFFSTIRGIAGNYHSRFIG